MTLRGRLTLLVALGGLLATLWRGALAREPEASVAHAVAPPVFEVGAEPPRLRVPDAILRRLPPTARGGWFAPTETTSLAETVKAASSSSGRTECLQVEYTVDLALARRVARILRRGRVALGHVIVLDPSSGRVLAYASTDPERLSPTRSYSAASLIKVVTAAATLRRAPDWAARPCRYRGNPYRLTPTRLDPPRRGRTASFRRALATSNNQCFAQLAVHALGVETLLDEIRRFGLLESPAPGHSAGHVDPVEDRFDLGRLGSGLSGCRFTPLGAAQLAATLAAGELVEPRWVARVTNGSGEELELPPPAPRRRVLPREVAAELRTMLVETTERGTARRAFRNRRGRALLAPIRVAGKTGSLTGRNPDGRYEWFIGVAPAQRPRLAIATLVVHGDLWWRNASQLAAEVLKAALCSKGPCRVDGA
jgi:cell division protein FtsI/penicillin-binding protein 2